MNPCTTYWRRNLRPSTPRFRSNDHAYRSVDVAARRSSRAWINVRPRGTRRSGSIEPILAPRAPDPEPEYRVTKHVVAVPACAQTLDPGADVPLPSTPPGTYCTAPREAGGV